MNLVRQKHSRGCGVAVLAMVTGENYDSLASLVDRDLESLGLYQQELAQLLYERGFALLFKYLFTKKRIDGEQIKTEPWPPAPFAPVHICNVKVHEGAPVDHFVVMDNDGVIFDPMKDETGTLSDYWRTSNVAGIFLAKSINSNA